MYVVTNASKAEGWFIYRVAFIEIHSSLRPQNKCPFKGLSDFDLTS